MKKKITKLAFQGNWDELLTLLSSEPGLANTASETKGYAPLHQAAWHGANLKVVGQLLALGANRGLLTLNDNQTAQDIAREKHPDRLDLEYILGPGKRTVSQLLRKAQTDIPDLFSAYDGNQVVFDRLVEFFSSDFCNTVTQDIEARIESAFTVLTGVSLIPSRQLVFRPCGDMEFSADTSFWRRRLLPELVSLYSRACSIPIEQEWAVVSDLFEPAPEQWGLRGDPFLWIEMRQMLSHVEIPQSPDELARLITSAFMALTGRSIERNSQFFVKRLSRSGMSSGMVCCDFWSENFVPLLQQRAKWLQESWLNAKSDHDR